MTKRQVLYLLTGSLCDGVVWSKQVEALADSGIAIRVIDFRGFRSIRDMAHVVLESAPERFALAGHSMGARVALEAIRTDLIGLNGWRCLTPALKRVEKAKRKDDEVSSTSRTLTA